MMSTQSNRSIPVAPIRWGAWLIPVGGLVPAIIFTVWMASPNPDIATDPKGAAEAAASAVGLASGFLYILAHIGLLFGMMALYGWIAAGRTGGPALAGLVLSVVSIGVLLAGFGAAILASTVAGDVYLAGDTGASGVLEKLSGGTFGRPILIDLIIASVIGLAGAVAFGVAIWRSGTLPKWSGVLYALGFVLVVAFVPIITHIGGILLTVGGVWIARTIGQGGETAVTAPAAASTI